MENLIETENELTTLINQVSVIAEALMIEQNAQFYITYPKPSESRSGNTIENKEKLKSLSKQVNRSLNDLSHLKRARGVIRRYIKNNNLNP